MDGAYFIKVEDFYTPRGVDGQGHNRLSIIPLSPSDRCSLQPQIWQAAWDTARGMARYGVSTSYGRCTNHGDCSSCPVASKPRDTWNSEWMLREDRQGLVWLLDIADREEGWSAFGHYFKSWTALFAAVDVPPLKRHVDETGPYFIAR